MRVVCVSDTHNQLGKVDVPDGDVLVHAGDATMRGTAEEIGKFAAYLAALPHRYKLIIAGNHDWLFQTDPARALAIIHQASDIYYLQDSGVEIEGVKFWGAPWQPEYHDWAFNLPRGPALGAKWALVPDDTDVLVTHGPPWGVLDQVDGGEHLGCQDLRLAVLDRVMPSHHVFGHIHDGHGRLDGEVTFVNASICDESYAPVNAPITFEVG